MTLSNKIMLTLLILTVICSVGFVLYKEHQMTVQAEEINKSVVEFRQLANDIARSQAQYATKSDIDNFAKQNGIELDAVRKDLSTLGATVAGINQITVVSGGQHQTNAPSTTITPGDNTPPTPTVNCNGKQIPCPDLFGFLHNTQHIDLFEKFADANVPLASVAFEAWHNNPWSYTVYSRTYKITNILGHDTNDRHYVYNKMIVNSNGKDYPVKITNAEFKEEYPTPSFTLFNPRLYIGTDGGMGLSDVKGEFTPNVGIAISSYGSSLVTPDWSFAHIGLGYNVVGQRPTIQISPAQYNIGKHIPLMKNVFIGPTVGSDFSGHIVVGGGIRVGL
jgi:hypothetical protein